MEKSIDLVVGGPDMSGTSTQINDIIDFFASTNNKVRDMRGTEIQALFHAKMFSRFNKGYRSLSDFRRSSFLNRMISYWIVNKSNDLLSDGGTNQDLHLASMVENDISTFVDPDSADVWIFEEPTKRGAGKTNRFIEQNRSKFQSEIDPISAALNHQSYRTEEYLRFRKPLRENKKVIVRSRSEESGCYQVFDKKYLLSGIGLQEYLSLPGHKIAFANPPTHIFIVSAPEDWTKEEYLRLKEKRSNGRLSDDHEKNADYQLLVNKRYTSDWIDEFYNKGCNMHGGDMPEIIKIRMYDSSREERSQKVIRDEIWMHLAGICKDW